jgi:hypothetical protein
MNFLKFLMLLALCLWLGGILFFSAVEAPLILSHVHDRTVGGEIINRSLAQLHWLGMISGLVFLLASLVRGFLASENKKLFTPSNVIVLVMLASTAVSQYFILPAIAQLRAVQSTAVPADAVAAARFQHLHSWSVGLEAAVLFLGFLVLYLQASDAGSRR